MQDTASTGNLKHLAKFNQKQKTGQTFLVDTLQDINANIHVREVNRNKNNGKHLERSDTSDYYSI